MNNHYPAIVDSHCHLNCLDLSLHEQSIDKALEAAQQQGVKHFLCVSIDLTNFPQVLSLAKTYDNISASVGLHPNVFDEDEPSVEQLVALANDPEIIAIGETGLDYCRTDESQRERQQQRFRHHIRVAKMTNKPLIIHMRDADDDTINIMREEGAAEVGGVMHCFTAGLEVAKKALDLNFYISLSGIVTFKNAKALQAVAQQIPIDKLLIETDCPYLAPVPMRGKSNEPAYLRHTGEFLARLREMEYEQFAAKTSANFFKLFSLAAPNFTLS